MKELPVDFPCESCIIISTCIDTCDKAERLLGRCEDLSEFVLIFQLCPFCGAQMNGVKPVYYCTKCRFEIDVTCPF